MILADRTVTIAEWDWVDTPEDDFAFLHHADRLDHPHEDWVSGSGRTSCGLEGHLSVPGILSRMSTERCEECCHVVGYYPGTGSPKNDRDLKHSVRQRIVALHEGREYDA